MEAVPANLLDAVLESARGADVFAAVEAVDGGLRCPARHVADDAWYQVGPSGTCEGRGCVWVGLYVADRWISGSIEADVLHQGDKFEDLLEEELVDLGFNQRLKVEHFRDDDKVFVFRSAVPEEAEAIGQVLLAYEACFRELGDMTPDEED